MLMLKSVSLNTIYNRVCGTGHYNHDFDGRIQQMLIKAHVQKHIQRKVCMTL